MTSQSDSQDATSPQRGPARTLLVWFASLKLAVILIVSLAAILAWATFMEADRGREYAQWYVYKADWFIALLGLLTVNIFSATLVRFPWKLRQTGFLITHAGLLVLLAGSVVTFWKGVEGQISMTEAPRGQSARQAEPANTLLLTGQSVITASWRKEGKRVNLDFAFAPGAADWPDGKTRDLGESDGVGIRVLKFCRYARKNEDWTEDPSGRGMPAAQFALSGPDGKTIQEEWLMANRFGSEVAFGPTRVAIYPAPVASMLEDFASPPTEGSSEAGILSVHYEGRMQRIVVDENKGEKVPLTDSEIAVEIVDYFPDAVPTGGGRFASRSDRPKNPLLELLIHLPDRNEPVRQIAFAKTPMLNLDGVYGSVPVKFYYYHPAIDVPIGAEFLQTPDGKLHSRVAAGEKYEFRGEVKLGERIETAAGFGVTVQQYIPHAQKKVSFRSIKLAAGETSGPEAAALVEVNAWGTKEEIWLKRFDPQHGTQTVPTAQRPLEVSFGYGELPLDFSLKLIDFQRGVNPGGMGNASFSSSVTLTDLSQDINEEEHLISMNQPLTHGKFTFYQSSYRELGGGVEMSILSVAYDPGRFLKYLGSLMICIGTLVMICRRAKFFGNGGSTESNDQRTGAGARSKKRKKRR